MAIGNLQLMHESCPRPKRMGTARIKYDKKTEEGKQESENMPKINLSMK